MKESLGEGVAPSIMDLRSIPFILWHPGVMFSTTTRFKKPVDSISMGRNHSNVVAFQGRSMLDYSIIQIDNNKIK
jgi:hypothetical protein